MKNFKKYSNWSLVACLALASPLFSACNDDDVKIEENIPDSFRVELSNLNINWDETEGFVQFDSYADWKVESSSHWISIDPNKGNPGSYRTYFIFEPNPYRLPRKGEIKLTCGDEEGIVYVTQAGCTDDSRIAPITIDLEIPSFDYQTEEVPFSSFSDQIMGNLGLTMAEFGQGVDEEGDLEFFMIGKDGSWYKGGTSGTRMGAWLDGDYNVVGWDGAGYPAIASFIEIYGGEDPVLVIGRAPGVPENTTYVLNFGIASSDLKNYQYFTVNVNFVGADLKGELIETINLEFSKEISGTYDPEPCQFDSQAVASKLGASSIALCKVVSYDADGEFIPYTANNGYWFNAQGAVCSYPGIWYIEYYGNDEEATAEDMNVWQIGNFPDCDPAAGISKIGFWYNGNVVMFNIHVTIGDATDLPPVEEPTPEPSVEIVAEKDLFFTAATNEDYPLGTVEFDMDAVLAALGCPDVEELEYVSYGANGEKMPTTATEGFWYLEDGQVGSYGDAVIFIEYYYEDNTLAIGHMPGGDPLETTCLFGFEYKGKAYLFNVHITITE